MQGARVMDGLDHALAEGRTGVLLVNNVDDRLVDSSGRHPTVATPYAIVRNLAERGYHTALVSLSGGVAPAGFPSLDLGASPIPRRDPTDSPEQMLRELTPLLRSCDQRVAILLRHPSHFAPCSSGLGSAGLDLSSRVCTEILYEWSIDEQIRRAGNFIVLLDPEDQVHELLRDRAYGFKLIRAGYPTRTERERFVQECLEGKTRRTYGPLEDGLGPDRLAALTGGLRLVEIEALLCGAGAGETPLSEETVRALRAEKISERLEDLAEVKEPTIGWENVAGIAHVKEYFQEVARGARLGPSGVSGSTLLAGVPGVGKSYTVQALARELRVPIVFVRNLYDCWVGSSEAKVERLIETLVAFDGCVCVFEEVDQLLGRRDGRGSGDGGTTERVRGRLMEFMGGSNQGIHFVGLTNRPDLLDVANLDRFGVLIPVLHPSSKDVIELLATLLEQEHRAAAPDLDIRSLSRLPNLRVTTARGLRDIVREAGRLADREQGRYGSPIAKRHLERVARLYQPKHDPIEHEFLALTAVTGCQFQAYLPWMSWDGRRKDVEVPVYLEDLVDRESGSVDQPALRRRLEELSTMRSARASG